MGRFRTRGLKFASIGNSTRNSFLGRGDLPGRKMPYGEEAKSIGAIYGMDSADWTTKITKKKGDNGCVCKS